VNLYLKPGVDLRQMSPQTLLAWMVATEIYERHGYPCRVTSLKRDGTWEQVMLHGSGNAVDLGIRAPSGDLLPDNVIDSIVEELGQRIGRQGGGQYDVVDERAAVGGPHIHIEFDPK
jgi:hypothetical protein